MAGISIALSSLDEYKDINVEGLGVIRVKKESSNQGLKSSENIRDIYKLQDESKALSKKVKKLIESGAGEDDEEIVKLNTKGTDKLDRITEIRKSEQDMKKSRMSDYDGGKLVEYLFNNANDEDIARIFALAEEVDADTKDILDETN